MLEHEIEKILIKKMQDLKYTYRDDIRDRKALDQNFREKFQTLNRVNLTDTEFERLMEEIITPDVFTASKILREQQQFEREDGTPLFYTLVNTKDWCKNTFEVVNQLSINTQYSHHRYDVILLINGVPVVQIELKTLDISPRRAMQQIVNYKNDPGNGYSNSLLCFMQLFIVSNQNITKYFTNNNDRHFCFDANEQFIPVYQFADEDNNKISDLDTFAEKFLAKCTLAEMISHYMVLVATEQKLLMMRPYQIYAVKAIINCIHLNDGNGYIWHTTGSGKTLTSFKASTLLKDNPDIEKCLFVVDRKDLDRQTREEFNKFQEGCVEENTNTHALVQRLLSTDYADKVIVTTIQKLGLALDDNNSRNYKKVLEPLSNKRVVFIFDECHRSQFGENHKAIKDFFPRAQLFGFTGTPIFEENATYRQIEGQEASYRTTADLFQKELHAYTITHAIEDQYVLRFHIDYFKPDSDEAPEPGEPISKAAIVKTILDKHDAATAGRKFNALLATGSINDAIDYYQILKKRQSERYTQDLNFQPLNIACVFTPPAEGSLDIRQLQEDLPQEKADNTVQPERKKTALAAIIKDYNTTFGTNHSIGDFDSYYKDVQKRIKDQQYPDQDLSHDQKIDLTIVVDMLLTGFDAKYLNTLYVDKKLQYHGLIQAFSRTNRILNKSKPYGNILDFRQQQDQVDEAMALFSGENIARAKEIWLVDPAPIVIEKLQKAFNNLDMFMRSQNLTCEPSEVPNLKGDAARSLFINMFKEIQYLTTQLDQYTDLTQDDIAAIEALIPRDKLQAFRGVYLETAKDLKDKQERQEDDPDIPQLEFDFVLFASAIIDYDYIMALIARYTQEPSGSKEKMSREQLIALILSDAKFIDEREDITAYINTLQKGQGLTKEQVLAGYEHFKHEQYIRELTQIADAHGLEYDSLQTFVETILRRMIFDGEQLTELLKPLNLGWKARTKEELSLMADLIPLLKKRAQGREISGLRAYE